MPPGRFGMLPIAGLLGVAALANATPITFSYTGNISAQPGTAFPNGAVVDLTYTFDSAAMPLPQFGPDYYPILSATARVGDTLLTPNYLANTYIAVQQNFFSNGEYMDNYVVQVVDTTRNESVTLILRETSPVSPPGALSGPGLPLVAPDPANFHDLAFFAVFIGAQEFGSGRVQLVTQAVPEPATLILFPAALGCLALFRICGRADRLAFIAAKKKPLPTE